MRWRFLALLPVPHVGAVVVVIVGGYLNPPAPSTQTHLQHHQLRLTSRRPDAAHNTPNHITITAWHRTTPATHELGELLFQRRTHRKRDKQKESYINGACYIEFCTFRRTLMDSKIKIKFLILPVDVPASYLLSVLLVQMACMRPRWVDVT